MSRYDRMTKKQYLVDTVLWENVGPPMTARQVADCLGNVSREAALSRLKALERNGYVRSWYAEPGVKVWRRR